MPQADEFIVNVFRGILRNAPKTVFTEVDDPDTGTPLIELIRDPNDLITAIYWFAEHTEHEKAKVFDDLYLQLWKNTLHAVGLIPEDAVTEKIKKRKDPWDSDLPPLARCKTFLRNTPFLDLLLMPLPFEIPIETRFQHHWIVAPPGAGKSTTLQHFILRDLELVAANKASIVVMESNRDLIKAIEGLKEFAPGERLNGKLVVIDAEDIECPVALNLFDVGLDDHASSPADREAFRNAVLAQYEYIFSALLSAEFTSRQNTLFTFTLELLLAIPGATLDTLVDLMGPDGIKNFRQYVETLDPDARKYFQLKFDSKDLSKTKDQVLDRLFALKRMRTLSRMFSAPKSKLDFFKEMGSAKVILINVPQSLLQEEGVEIVGRFFISMILLAAQKRQLLPKHERLPCFVYIDECQDFIKRDPKITAILDQARKFNVGLILAHQRLQQLQPAVLDALYGATAIKYASKISDAAAHALARDMRTTPEFILNQPPYHFAAYVRGLTDTAISTLIPPTDMNKMARMTDDEQRMVRQAIRNRYGITPGSNAQPNRSVDNNKQSSVQKLGPSKPNDVPPLADDWRS